MRVCSSTNATTVRRFCGQSRETAACSALSAPCPVRRSNNGLIAAHDTTGGAGYPLIGLVTSEGFRFDRGDGCTQSGMNDPPLTSTTMPVMNAAASDARNATTSATSRGVPSRPTAVSETLRSNARVLPAVLPGPGQFNAAGVFAAVLILVLVGVTELLTRLERGSAPAVLPF